MDNAAAERKSRLAVESTKKGKVFFSDNKTNEFNRGCDHIANLLKDSHRLYSSASFSTSVFLSITAIEEIAKMEISLFRSDQNTVPATRREDSLFSHKSKHSIALQEVITVGRRLPEAIGNERVRRLLDMAESGELLKLRESALYSDNVGGRFTCPADHCSLGIAREVLLLALEVWDDRLVGITNHTYEVDIELVRMFSEVAAASHGEHS